MILFRKMNGIMCGEGWFEELNRRVLMIPIHEIRIRISGTVTVTGSSPAAPATPKRFVTQVPR